MRKRKHLQTDFIKFIFEKYSKEGQNLPEDEIDEPQRKKPTKINEIEDDEDEIKDDEETTENEDDEIIDELLNEYKRLKKKYESNRIHIRRKR